MSEPRELSYRDAIAECMRQEMRRDERVFMMGEDIRSGIFGDLGNAEFGARVRNTPISEAGFVGAAVGAALTGLRPIVDMTISVFLYSCMDQVVSQASKSRYMFGSQASLPIVIRAGLFYGGSQAAHHSDRPYPMFMNSPGLKIIVPSNPHDAKGLLAAAVREDDPVLCFEDGTLQGSKGIVPEDEYVIPLGVAEVKREGSDVTLVAVAGSVPRALAAAATLAEEGISVEVIDPRSLVPLDTDAVLRSVAKTGRLVIADPATRTCGAAAEIAAVVAEDGFDLLRAPIVRVTTPDVPIPFSPLLERQLWPDEARITIAVRQVLGAQVGDAA